MKVDVKSIFIILVILTISFFIGREAFFHMTAQAPEENEISNKEMVDTLDALMGNYYKTQDILTIPTILKYISNLNVFEYSKHKPAVIGFLTGVIHQEGNKEFVSDWKKLKISSKTKRAIDIAVIVEPQIEGLLKREQFLKDIKSIDFYWGYFAATYDERCVKLIINTKNNKDLPVEVQQEAEKTFKANKSKYNLNY